MKDDYNVFVQEGALRTDRLTEAFLDGIRKLRSIGGLAVVATHTQIVGTDRRLEAIRTVLDTAQAEGDWWIARAGAIADWWTRRAAVRIEALPPTTSTVPSEPTGVQDEVVAPTDSTSAVLLPRGPEFRVSIPASNSGLSGLWIDIVLPSGEDPSVALVDGEPVSFVVTRWGVRVPIDSLAPGTHRRVALSFAIDSPTR
jgi:hypothetical protein